VWIAGLPSASTLILQRNISMSIYTSPASVPYIYRITDQNGKWYIGSRTAKNCNPNDLGSKYFTSCREIHQSFKQNPRQWRKEILYIGTLDDDIQDLEGLILETIDAKNDPMSYNKHNNEKLTEAGWNSSKAGKLGIQKMSRADRRRGGLKNGVSGHNQRIASIGGNAYAKKVTEDLEFRKTVSERSSKIASIKFECNVCGLITNRGNLGRWHNENCKERK